MNNASEMILNFVEVNLNYDDSNQTNNSFHPFCQYYDDIMTKCLNASRFAEGRTWPVLKKFFFNSFISVTVSSRFCELQW